MNVRRRGENGGSASRVSAVEVRLDPLLSAQENHWLSFGVVGKRRRTMQIKDAREKKKGLPICENLCTRANSICPELSSLQKKRLKKLKSSVC